MRRIAIIAFVLLFAAECFGATAINISPSDAYCVVLSKPDGTKLKYTSAADTNLARGDVLETVLSIAEAGDTVLVYPGYYITSTLIIPADVTLLAPYGLGTVDVNIPLSGGTRLVGKHNSRIKWIRFLFPAGGAYAAYTNSHSIIEDCEITGNVDCIFFSSYSGGTTELIRTNLSSNFDCVNSSTDGNLIAIDCNFTIWSDDNNPASYGILRGLTQSAGSTAHYKLVNCRINGFNMETTGTPYIVSGVSASYGTHDLKNCVIKTSSVIAPTYGVYDVNVLTGAEVNAFNCIGSNDDGSLVTFGDVHITGGVSDACEAAWNVAAATDINCIVVTKKDGTKLKYAASADTDVARGTVLATVAALDTNNCVIYIGPGDFNNNTQITFGPNSTWIGSGRSRTKLISSYSTASALSWIMSDNTVVKGIYFDINTVNANLHYGLGNTTSTTGLSARIEDCKITGNTDCIYFSNSGTVPFDLWIVNNLLESNYEAIMIIGSGGPNTSRPVVPHIIGNDIRITSSTSGYSTTFFRGIINNSGLSVRNTEMDIRDCNIQVYSSSTGSGIVANGIMASTPSWDSVKVINCRFNVSQSGATSITSVADFRNGTTENYPSYITGCIGSGWKGDIVVEGVKVFINPVPKTPKTVIATTTLTDANSEQTLIFNSSSVVTINLPQAGDVNQWTITIIDGNNTAGADPNIKPYNGDNIVKIGGTALAADEGYHCESDAYAKLKLIHYAIEPNVIREELIVGTWTEESP